MEVRTSPIFASLFGKLILLIAAFVYSNFIYLAGFPDGGISELGRAELILYKVFIIISIVLGFYSFTLVNDVKALHKKLSYIIIIYLVSTGIVFLADYYFRFVLKLMDDAGG